MKIQNQLLPNKQEIITYDYPGIPIHTETRSLSDYKDMRSVLHWHDDLELMRVISGKMYYCTDIKRTLLQTNDSVLVNSRKLHYYTSVGGQDCTFSCVTMNPQLLTGSQVMREQFIDPVLNNTEHTEFFFSSTHKLHSVVVGISDEIIEGRSKGDNCYLMTILARFQWLFFEIVRSYDLYADVGNGSMEKNIYEQMTNFITLNYMNKISVDDIAKAGLVSRSKCYNLFQENDGITPLDYLNGVRLKTACGLLRDSKLKIIDISDACGFSYCNYFTQAFKKKYDMTPAAFRKRLRELQ